MEYVTVNDIFRERIPLECLLRELNSKEFIAVSYTHLLCRMVAKAADTGRAWRDPWQDILLSGQTLKRAVQSDG